MFIGNRIADAVQWRTEALIERLPRRVRTWIFNQRAGRRARRGETSIEHPRLILTYQECLRILLRREPAEELGDYLEFGVFHGSTLACMHKARGSLGLDKRMRLFGFDSFEGLPATAAEEDDGLWAPGQFRATLKQTQENLTRWGVPLNEVTLIKGWFKDTATQATRDLHHIEKVSVVMIDCDLYSSTVDALAFAGPLVDRQAVFVFDDWNAGGLADRNMGERKAFEEFLQTNPEFTAEEIPDLNYRDKADPKLLLVTRR